MRLRLSSGSALATVILATLLLAAFTAPAQARGKTTESAPAPFVGVNVDGPVWSPSEPNQPAVFPGVNLQQQLAQMERDGVEQIRVVFDWAFAQPYPGTSEVPPSLASYYTDVNGIPTDFAQTDEIMGLAAQYGLSVLPVVIDAPYWDSSGASSSGFGQPAVDGPYAAYLTDLIERYGPHGSFWSGDPHPDPITQWEIWNEPNLSGYWPTQPFAPTYVALLAAAHAAITRADPGAKVILGGLTDSSWTALRSVYRVPGSRRDFNVVAIHPYTKTPAGVIEILRLNRQVMDAYGARSTPIVADELGWSSALGQTEQDNRSDVSSTLQGQAQKLAALMPMLEADRSSLGLEGFDVYTWASQPITGGYTFDFSGLLSYSNDTLLAKPALAAFAKAALRIEGCVRKGALASECAVPITAGRRSSARRSPVKRRASHRRRRSRSGRRHRGHRRRSAGSR
jgi:hypothetical protein